MSHLAPCPSCNRHVDVGENTCPFCTATLSVSFRAQQAPAPPRGRLSRVAMMAAGATLMGAAACSATLTAPDGSPAPTGGAAGAEASGGAGGRQAAGGAAGFVRDAGQDRTFIAIYGAPTPAYGISLPPPQLQDASEPDSSDGSASSG